MKKKWPKTILTFTCVFVFAILLRLFVIEIYSIPSGSMEDTLLPGDKVLVNKLAYGPKLPVSPYDIPWVNLIWYLQAGASANPDSVYWDYRRLPGFSSVKRGDVMVFARPLKGNRNNFFIKRCVALPGDTVAIENGLLKINGRIERESPGVKRIYEIRAGNREQLHRLADSLGVDTPGRFGQLSRPDHMELNLTAAQKNLVLASGYVDSLKAKIIPTDSTHSIHFKQLSNPSNNCQTAKLNNKYQDYGTTSNNRQTLSNSQTLQNLSDQTPRV